jgi:transglutaminase-like putative cysteine protease/tetratricopeptide (TPR) repeat protein
MRSTALIFAALCVLVSRAGLAQTQTTTRANAQATTAPTDPYASQPAVIERWDTTYRMNADGTGERDMHVVVRIQSEGAVQQFGVLSFSYASANESPSIKFVRVLKPDGSTVETPAADAMEMPADVTREAPLYSDLKEMHVPVRSLAAGDRLEYEVNTTIEKPEAPGEFWGAWHFTAPGTVVVLAEVLTLQVPADKYVQVWSPNHKPAVTTGQNGVRTYTWNVAQLVIPPHDSGDASDDDAKKLAAPQDPDENADGQKVPSVAWTTFHNWTEVGDWYRSLALKQAAPSDAIRARADEITASAKTPEEQVRALYEFVSTHTRYVGIDFGIGRYQPHTAAEVLANQYGDCKDKDTLLEALLHAKGFSTSPALVGVGVAAVPEVPSPAVFNHVITTVNLPTGRIWLDSTPPAAPYEYLSSVIRDQKALIVPADKAATLEPTPATAPYPFSARFEAVGTLDAEGKLTAKMTASYRDDDEAVVRALVHSVAAAEWDKVSQFVSAQTGFSGTTSDTHFENTQDTAKPLVLTYDYQRHPYGDWDDRRIVPLFPALEFPTLDSDTTAPEHDIQLGAPRTLTAISHIKLPEGYRPDLPDAIHVKTDFATFDKTYKFDGDEILAERQIVILKSRVAKADWQKYETFTKDISLSGEAWIALSNPEKLPEKPAETTTAEANKKPSVVTKNADGTVTVQISKSAVPAAAGSASAAGNAPGKNENAGDHTANAQPADDRPAEELIAEASSKMRERDWSGARDLLDQVKAKNDKEENLWAMYGFIAEVDSHDNELAKTDFKKELDAHPDNPLAVGSLAEIENRTGDTSAARKTVSDYLKLHPDNTRMSLYLASLENQAEDYEGALKTLQASAEKNPDDRSIQLQISNELLRLDRKEEAAAAARAVLDGTDDPGMLNDAAYMLAESGIGLDAAEDASRKSIAKLEEKSATITTAEVNSNAFAQANLLIASWDTLGWILYREGKPEAALPYISATWHASLLAESGDHLGQIYEALGRRDDAESVYVLAQAALTKTDTPDVRNHIHESAARLRNAGAKAGPANPVEALQQARTYKVKKPKDASGWGTFRLEITTAGVIESQQMSGDQKISAVKTEIDEMKFPELIPPGSKAHLLRSAVVSCSMGANCEVVLVPDGGLQTEEQQ